MKARLEDAARALVAAWQALDEVAPETNGEPVPGSLRTWANEPRAWGDHRQERGVSK